MAKKKIGFVTALPGSARAFLMEHFKFLLQEYEVHLVTNYKSDDEMKEFEEIGIVCHNVDLHRAISIGADLKALFALRKLFRREKFDAVHSVTPKAGLLSSTAGWLARTPIRIHIFTGQVWATRKGAMRLLLKTMDKITTRFCTNVLVDGEGQRQFLIKEGVLKEKNSKVLADGSIAGVKLERFAISQEIRIEERTKLGLKEDDVCFIFLGRLNHDKGIGELFEAFNALVPDCSNAKLLLYGTDEEGYDLKADNYPNIKRGENYFYPGRTSSPYNALQAGDVFVLPTWREGFGMSVIEAQALGLPVITSNAYGVVDASVEGETGLRCGVNDPKGLYECMKKYYNDPDMRHQHGQAGHDRIVQYFDNKIVSKAWVEFYHELLKGE